MGSRLKLHEEFRDILGSEYVYFNPPESVKMTYPCIRYSLGVPNQYRADGRIYKNTNGYEVTVIDYDPESEIPDKIQDRFPYSRIVQRFRADNLNHTILSIYY